MQPPGLTDHPLTGKAANPYIIREIEILAFFGLQADHYRLSREMERVISVDFSRDYRTATGLKFAAYRRSLAAGFRAGSGLSSFGSTGGKWCFP